jgi:hypothetical protein
MTGTTLFSISRILSGWERQGLVRVGRERVIVCRLDSLLAVAEDLPPDKLTEFFP